MDVRPVRVSGRFRSRYRLAASTAFSSREKEASIPDDSAVQAAPQLDGLAHALGSTTEEVPQCRVSTSVAGSIAATP